MGKPLSAVVCLLQSIIYNQMEETLSNKLTAATLKDCWLKNIEGSKYKLIFVTTEDCWLKNIEGSKYKLIFVTTEEVSSKPFLSWLKQMLHHFTHQFCVYFVFFFKTVLLVLIELIRISYMLLSRLQWCATNWGVLCFSTASLGWHLFAFPYPPPPTTYISKSNMVGWINDCKLLNINLPL